MAFIRDCRECSARCGRTRSQITAALFVVFASFMVSYAAQAGDLGKVVAFNIEAQTLDKALLEFGAQAHVQIMFAWDSATAKLRIKAVKGRHTARDALGELLRGTRLMYVEHGNTVEILLMKTTAHDALSTGFKEDPDPPGHGGSRHMSRPVAESSDSPAEHPENRKPTLTEVVITGSRLLTTSKETAQEVQIYDRQQIHQTGQNSVSDFLTTLPSVSLTAASTAVGIASTVRLRGLPVGTTLVLVNGRRIENSGLAQLAGGGDYFDLNNIPLAAVQRIEVSETGASAVYGSDAIGGVVNIILRKDFNGFEADAKYGSGKDFGVTRTSLAFGRQWNRAGFSLTASYGIDGGLIDSERLLSANNDYTSYGGPDNNYPICSPGNVFSTTRAPLPGASLGSTATFAAVTGPTAAGRPPISQFSYGSLNTCSLISGLSILPSTHRAGIFLQGHLEVAPSIELFTELMYTHVSQVDHTGYAGLFGIPTIQLYKVPASNPYNPFGTTVGIAEKLRDVPTFHNYDTDFFRPLVGLKGTLPHRWQWELSAWQSTDWTHELLPNAFPNSLAIQNGLNSSNPATALNPFVNGPIAPPPLLHSLFTDGNIKVEGSDRSAEAFIRGPVVRLPAGYVEAVVGGDYVRSTLYNNDINDGVDPPNARFRYQRQYYAAFGEAKIPLIGPRHSVSAKVLTFTVAARHDHYSDFGGDSTEQFGLELRPIEGVLVRGAYGNAFKAPSLPSLDGPQKQLRNVVTDPVTGTPALVQLVTGGNPGLHPLTGHSHTVAVVYAGHSLSGLLLSVAQWHVVENNDIESLPPQVIVSNANLFPGRVVRDAAGIIGEVIDTQLNFGSIDVAGIDYQLNYRHPVGGSAISTDISATEIYHYMEALQPSGAALETVGRAEDDGNWAPRWKATVGIGWTEGGLTGHFDGRYTGSYQDYDSTRHIGNIWVFDANLHFALGHSLKSRNHWLGSAYVEAGATNIFNRAPQFSNYDSDFYGYDASEMSITGRVLYVELGVHW